MLRCYHDVPSAASAVAVLRLQRLADEGLHIEFEGFETHPLGAPLPITLDVLAERDQWKERAAELGLDLRRPANVPPTALVHAIGELAAEAGLGGSWRGVAYRAYWEQAADLSDAGMLRQLADQAGLDDDAVGALLSDPAAAAGRIRRRAGRRRAAGVGAVPMLEVSGALVPADLTDGELRQLAS